MRTSLTFILFVILTLPVFSQNFETTNTGNYGDPFFLINDVFAGGNVNISNVQQYPAGGQTKQIGFFRNGQGIGIDSGIVLSTGDIDQLCTGNCPNVGGTPSPAGGNPAAFGFPWMGTQASNVLLQTSQGTPAALGQTFSTPSDVNNAAAISFDFVPTRDTMQFRFVFASSEWDTYPCGVYNDVFGFFVAGPGITGGYAGPPGYANSENFAVVPGTNPAVPISISSITSPTNPGNCSQANYPQFYIENIPANTGINTGVSAMNAHTSVMTVTFPVQKCQTYSFTMAIAHGEDGALDSHVFMEANSFDASGLQIVAAPSYTTLGGDSILYEGCGDVTLNFERHDSIHLPDTIPLAIFGNATPLVDFTYIPDTIFFAPGVSQQSITFSMIHDMIPEGVDTLKIAVADTSVQLACGQGSDTVVLYIHDPVPLITDAIHDTLTCYDIATFDANPLQGFPDYEYLWANGDTNQTVNLGAIANDTFMLVTITDACSIYTTVDTAHITIINPPVIVDAPGDTIDCETPGTLISVNASGMPNLQYNWGTGSNNSQFYVSNPHITQDYYVTVSQACANVFIVDTFRLHVDNPPFTLSTVDDTVECIDPPINITVNPSYTTPNFTYSWDNNVNTRTQIVDPNQTTQYIVSVTDACGVRTMTDTLMVWVINDQILVNTQNENIICVGDTAEIEVDATGGYPPYIYKWSTNANTYNDFVAPNQDTKYFVSVTDQCALDTIVDYVDVVLVEYEPLKIPPFDTVFLNCPGRFFRVDEIPTIGGSGNNIASWDNFNSTIELIYGEPMESKVFVAKAKDLCNLDQAEQQLIVYIPQHKPLQVELPADTIICPDEFVTLTPNVEGGGGLYKYKWSTGARSKDISFQSKRTNTYSVTVTEDCGSSRVSDIYITTEQPIADFEFDITDGSNAYFRNLSNNATGYNWFFGDSSKSDIEHPVHEYLPGTEYQVHLVASNEGGCSDTITKTVIPELQIFIPTGFTPNEDGINDVFKIEGAGLSEGVLRSFSIVIYDRWGKEVFRSTDPTFTWDGKIGGENVKVGSYVYHIEAKGHKKIRFNKSGSITISKFKK